MSMEFRWQDDPEAVFGLMADGYEAYIRGVIRNVCNQFVPQMEAFMKTNARWTDRTANARQSMYAELHELLYTFLIRADYGVEYGVFLELANGGRFSIVAPTIDVFAPRIFRAIQRALES